MHPSISKAGWGKSMRLQFQGRERFPGRTQPPETGRMVAAGLRESAQLPHGPPLLSQL